MIVTLSLIGLLNVSTKTMLMLLKLNDYDTWTLRKNFEESLKNLRALCDLMHLLFIRHGTAKNKTLLHLSKCVTLAVLRDYSTSTT